MASNKNMKKTANKARNSKAGLKMDFSDEKTKKRIITAIVAVVVIIMVASMIVPYMGGNSGTYKLSDSALKGDVEYTAADYNPQDILVGETYNRVDKEYVVLFGTAEQTSNMAAGITKLPVYTVDSTTFDNSSLTKDVTNASSLPQAPKDIKISKELALIRIKDGKATVFKNTSATAEQYIKELE
ncbi:hypothetical protein [Mycoplasma sp. P36-A1]|uniref:hypothetical protein n=1 Tax=Mycoplasma sp. P36-A1 TaxID=3252900 RepID=UPI003C2DE53A